jgi:hypothetical protein
VPLPFNVTQLKFSETANRPSDRRCHCAQALLTSWMLVALIDGTLIAIARLDLVTRVEF